MTAPNAALAYRVLDHIDAHPELWRQGDWHCGSAYCFGGWAVELSGGQLDDVRVGEPKVIGGSEALRGLGAEQAALKVLNLRTGWIWRDLSDERADAWLFDGDNDREDLGRIVAEIFGPRPAVTS